VREKSIMILNIISPICVNEAGFAIPRAPAWRGERHGHPAARSRSMDNLMIFACISTNM
jgi:hypothetical protein